MQRQLRQFQYVELLPFFQRLFHHGGAERFRRDQKLDPSTFPASGLRLPS